jgi:hypothetical protein
MVSVNRKTVAWKLPTVQVRECNSQSDFRLKERLVERPAFFLPSTRDVKNRAKILGRGLCLCSRLYCGRFQKPGFKCF